MIIPNNNKKEEIITTNLNEKTKDDELTNILLDPFSFYIDDVIKSLKSKDISNEIKKDILFEVIDIIILKKVNNNSIIKNIPRLYFLFKEDIEIYKGFMVLLGSIISYNIEIQDFLSKNEFYNQLNYNEDITYYVIKCMGLSNEKSKKFFIENIYDEKKMNKSIDSIFLNKND